MTTCDYSVKSYQEFRVMTEIFEVDVKSRGKNGFFQFFEIIEN